MRPMHAVPLIALLLFARIGHAQTSTLPTDQITGDVLTADGKPAAGAAVVVTGFSDYSEAETQGRVDTDSTGHFSLTASHKPRTVFAFIPGVALSVPDRTGATEEHFKLLPALDVELTCISPDGNPASGVTVSPRHDHITP